MTTKQIKKKIKQAEKFSRKIEKRANKEICIIKAEADLDLDIMDHHIEHLYDELRISRILDLCRTGK